MRWLHALWGFIAKTARIYREHEEQYYFISGMPPLNRGVAQSIGVSALEAGRAMETFSALSPKAEKAGMTIASALEWGERGVYQHCPGCGSGTDVEYERIEDAVDAITEASQIEEQK